MGNDNGGSDETGDESREAAGLIDPIGLAKCDGLVEMAFLFHVSWNVGRVDRFHEQWISVRWMGLENSLFTAEEDPYSRGRERGHDVSMGVEARKCR